MLAGTLAGYGTAVLALRRLLPERAELCAGSIVVVSLCIYWLWFDQSLHAENRYFLRTVVLLATTGLGLVAAVCVLAAEGRFDGPFPAPPGLLNSVASAATARAIAGGAALVMLAHAVETAKFVTAWTDYTAAVRALAIGAASDPALGDRDFVSSARVGEALNRLSWSSTTPYLSVVLAPRLAPARLVVDPDASYFWLSCKAAKANEAAKRRCRRPAAGWCERSSACAVELARCSAASTGSGGDCRHRRSQSLRRR